MAARLARYRFSPRSLKPGITRIRYLGEDVKRGAGNRGTIVRVGCALGALALLLITIASSSSGSPKTSSMFGNPTASAGTLGFNSGATSTASVTSSTPASTPVTTTASATTHHRSAVPHSGHATSTSSHVTTPVATTPHASSAPTASDQTSHTTTTATTPTAATTTTHTSTTPAVTTPTPPAPPEGCAMTGVRCDSPLIYQLAADAGTTVPVIGRTSYQGLALQTSFATITQRFGAPLSPAKLKTFLGVPSLNSLIQSQPSGEACAYYLDGANPTGRAFQLCFSSAYALVEKAILTSSG